MQFNWKRDLKYGFISLGIFLAFAPVAWYMGVYQVEHAQKRTVSKSYEEYVVLRTCEVVRYDEPKYFGLKREQIDMKLCSKHRGFF